MSFKNSEPQKPLTRDVDAESDVVPSRRSTATLLERVTHFLRKHPLIFPLETEIDSGVEGAGKEKIPNKNRD